LTLVSSSVAQGLITPLTLHSLPVDQQTRSHE